MVEQVSTEVIRKKPLSDLIADVFERRVSTVAVKKERKLIMETYADKFQALVETLPPERQKNTSIMLQKLFVTVGSFFSEYGARITDFVRNVASWPLVRATEDFPKDKYYQIELARAKAWGAFGRDTTKTATSERTAYRNHFLPSSVIGAEVGTVVGGALSLPVAMWIGVTEGAKFGLLAGAQGALIGAGVGGAIGGLSALALRLQDRVLGPPVVYYDLNAYSRSGGILSLNATSPASVPSRVIPGSNAI